MGKVHIIKLAKRQLNGFIAEMLKEVEDGKNNIFKTIEQPVQLQSQ